MIITILIFIVILGILVFVHEFGHFWVAKKSGMQVDEFGFGFPPRLAGIQKIAGKFRLVWGSKPPLDPEKTVYSINSIPFGGFVKIYGENSEDSNNPRSFASKGFWPRFFTLVAGVTMNWLLAFVLFTFAFGLGITSEINPDSPPPASAQISHVQIAISYIAPGLPAEKAGLMQSDIILNIDGKNFGDVSELQNYIKSNKGKLFNFEIQRINEVKNISVQSVADPKEGEGPTGIAISSIATVKLPWYQAISQGFQKTVYLTRAIFSGLTQLFVSKEAIKSVGGPIKIAQLTGQVASLGFVPILNFMGLLSINLAVLNILPIPALDGGRVLFLIIEKIRRKKNNQKLEQIVNTAGFAILILLMIVVTVKDIISK